MSDVNSNISGTQSGGFTTKDKVLNQTVGMESSIKSGANTPKRGGGLTGEFNTPVMEKLQKTRDRMLDFIRNTTTAWSFENNVPEVIYDV